MDNVDNFRSLTKQERSEGTNFVSLGAAQTSGRSGLYPSPTGGCQLWKSKTGLFLSFQSHTADILARLEGFPQPADSRSALQFQFCFMKFALYPHLLFGPILASLKF